MCSTRSMPRHSCASSDGEPSTRRRQGSPCSAAASSRAPLRASALAANTISGGSSCAVTAAWAAGCTQSSLSTVACGSVLARCVATSACGVTNAATRASATASARMSAASARKSRSVASSGQRCAAASSRRSISAIGKAPASTTMRRPSSAPICCRCGNSDCSTTSCVCSGFRRAAKARASQRWPSIRLACRRPACRAQSRCHRARRRLVHHGRVAAGSRCQPAGGSGRQNASRIGTGCMRSALAWCASR